MASKRNIRSMRFSDEIIQIIEAQPGDTFTAKFEGLVRKCISELPKKEQELKATQEAIIREREQLRAVQRAKTTFTQNLNNLDYSMRNLISQVTRCTKELESIKE